MRKYWATNKELDKILNDITKSRIKCKCGHSVVLPNRADKAICNWCGNYVFKNKEVEFKHRVKENLIKQKKES